MLIMLKYNGIALIIGVLLDLIIGDPKWLYHPVRIIGKEIELSEKIIRKILPKTPKGELIGGLLLVLIIAIPAFFVTALLICIAYNINDYIGIGVSSFICYQMIAIKSLKQESMKVYYALSENGLGAGRRAVSMIVGRDTEALSEEGVVKATVETVAENFSDGVIAPIFYMIIGGPALMMCYKAINTMDSMVGYKNQSYLYFGRAAARLDDAVNFLPARIGAAFMVLAAFFTGFQGKAAIKIFKRDRYNHKSPNSAQTESVMAGALGVQLAGNAYYFGKLVEKETIGDADRNIEKKDIINANRIMVTGSLLAAVILVFLHSIIVVCIGQALL